MVGVPVQCRNSRVTRRWAVFRCGICAWTKAWRYCAKFALRVIDGGACDVGGGLFRWHRSRQWCRPPYFNWFQDGEPNDFETALNEFSYFRVCTSVNYGVCHDVVGLEVVERDDRASS